MKIAFAQNQPVRQMIKYAASASATITLAFLLAGCSIDVPFIPGI